MLLGSGFFVFRPGEDGKMKNLIILAAIVMLAVPAVADTFGSGANQFTLEFVKISGDASSANGINISQHAPTHSGYKSFVDPGYDYRISKFETNNDQWNKFKSELGMPVTGSELSYVHDSRWTGANMPANNISWFEAAQFVNWLNMSKGHHEAYRFTGTQGTGDYTFTLWNATEAWGGTNLCRHKDAFYFLPSEDEWAKAAYWNGTTLQLFATQTGAKPIRGIDSNYGQTLTYTGPWNVGSGTEELNGTFDMMGNVYEWTDSPSVLGDSLPGCTRGGAFKWEDYYGSLYHRSGSALRREWDDMGFRVAAIPEPCTLLLLGLGGLLITKR